MRSEWISSTTIDNIPSTAAGQYCRCRPFRRDTSWVTSSLPSVSRWGRRLHAPLPESHDSPRYAPSPKGHSRQRRECDQ